MTTFKELEKWMLDNNIQNTFTPEARFVTDEGLGLEEVSGLYIWYFIERGERQNLDYFKSEEAAVRFVSNYIENNR